MEIDPALFASWEISEGDAIGEKYVFWKSVPEGADFNVSIIEIGEDYGVRISAEARAFGPSEIVAEVVKTLAEAITVAAEQCSSIDKDIEEWRVHLANLKLDERN